MTVDTFEWFSPCSGRLQDDVARALRGAHLDLNRHRQRLTLLRPEYAAGPAWEIIVQLFLHHGQPIKITALAHDLEQKQPVIMRWLLAMAADGLVYMDHVKDEIHLCHPLRAALIDYFGGTRYIAPLPVWAADLWARGSSRLKQHVRDAVAAGASAAFLFAVAVDPALHLLTR